MSSRNILIALIFVIVLVVGALIWGVMSLDSIVEAAIEETGSEMTETTVSVDSVSISLGESIASIKGLAIANPKSFKQEAPVISLGEIRATLDPNETTADVVVIKELSLLAPRITYEVGAQGSNVDTINKSVQKNTGTVETDPTSEPRFIIQRLSIEKGEIDIIAPNGNVASSDLPAINLTGLGAKSGGITGSEIGEIVIQRFKDETVKSTAKNEVKKYLNEAKDGLGDAVDKLFGRD